MGLCCQAMLSSFSLARMIFEHIFEWSVKLAGVLNWQSQKQCVDGLDVSADCGRSRVVIQHELLDETCNDPLVSWLVPAWVLDAMLVNEI